MNKIYNKSNQLSVILTFWYLAQINDGLMIIWDSILLKINLWEMKTKLTEIIFIDFTLINTSYWSQILIFSKIYTCGLTSNGKSNKIQWFILPLVKFHSIYIYSACENLYGAASTPKLLIIVYIFGFIYYSIHVCVQFKFMTWI